MKRNLTQALERWLADGFHQIGQVRIQRRDADFLLCHWEDVQRTDLSPHSRPEEARQLSTYDDAGEFRPLKTAPNLRHGWSLHVPDVAALRVALDYFYPAMLGVLLSQERGELFPVALRETLGRQTGMYAVTRKATDEQAQATICEVCNSGSGCLKTILWRISPEVPVQSLPATKFDPQVNQLGIGGPALPMLCQEPCNLLVAKLREVVKQ